MDPEVPEVKFCSNCKKDIAAANFLLHEPHCRKHVVLCEECHEPVPRTEMDSHYREEHAPLPCELCQKLIDRGNMETHKESECPETRINCKYCELDFRQADFREHEEGCGSRTDTCDQCGLRVMLRDMSEHQQEGCGHVKSKPRPALDTSGLAQFDDLPPQWEEPGGYGWEGGGHAPTMYYARRVVLSPDGTPRQQALIFTPPGVIPPGMGHAYYAPPMRHPDPPSAGGRSKEDKVDVDPQWLASVADVCGEDNIDQVLAQNMMIEDYRRTTPPTSPQAMYYKPVCRHHHHHHHHHAHDYLDDHSHGALDVAGIGRGGASGVDEQAKRDEQLQQDHEMARRIYDRDLEYARKQAQRLYPAAHDEYLGGDETRQGSSVAEEQVREELVRQELVRVEQEKKEQVRKEREREEQERKDAEYAWKLQQKDFEYAYKRSERLREEEQRKVEQEMSDEEYLHERAQGETGRATGGAYYNPDSYAVGRPAVKHSEDSDAKLAQQLHKRELAGVPAESRTGVREEAPHPISQEDADAKLARELYEREEAYVKRLGRDEMIAKTLQEYGEESERPRNGTYYATASDMYNAATTHTEQSETGFRGQESDHYYSAQQDTDARLAQDLDRRERAYKKSLERDQMLAREIQEKEKRKSERSEAIPGPDYHTAHHESYKPISDQEVEMTDEMLARKLMMEDDEDETFSSSKYASKYTSSDHLSPPVEAVIPCEHCKKVYPVQSIFDHQEQCQGTAGIVRPSTFSNNNLPFSAKPHPHSEEDTHLPAPSWEQQPRREAQPPWRFTEPAHTREELTRQSLSSWRQEHEQEGQPSQGHRANPLTSLAGEQHSVAVPDQPSWSSSARDYSTGVGAAEDGFLLTDDLLRKISSDSQANSDGWYPSQSRALNVSCGPCEVCGELVPMKELMEHQATCEAVQVGEMNGGSKELNVSSGPCDVCGELIPIKKLIRHEARCEARQMKPPVDALPAVAQPATKPVRTTPHSRPAAYPTSKASTRMAIRFPSQQSQQLSEQSSSTSSPTTITDSVRKARHMDAQNGRPSFGKKSTGYNVPPINSVTTRHSGAQNSGTGSRTGYLYSVPSSTDSTSLRTTGAQNGGPRFNRKLYSVSPPTTSTTDSLSRTGAHNGAGSNFSKKSTGYGVSSKKTGSGNGGRQANTTTAPRHSSEFSSGSAVHSRLGKKEPESGVQLSRVRTSSKREEAAHKARKYPYPSYRDRGEKY